MYSLLSESTCTKNMESYGPANGKGKKPVLDSNAKVSDGSAALSLPPQPTSPNPNSNP